MRKTYLAQIEIWRALTTRKLLLPSAYRGREAGLCAEITLN